MTARMRSPSAIPVGLEALAQSRQHRGMAARGVEAPRMIVMPFGRLVSGMAENKRSIPNVLRVVDRDHGCDAVAKHMREETAAKLPTRTEEDLESKGLIRELGPDFRHPDRVELRMNRRGVGIARLLPAPQQDRSMHA